MAKNKPAANRAKIGEKYNRLTIISEAGKANNGSIIWLCQCDCGKTTLSNVAWLRNETKKSCGCLNNETRINRRYKEEETSLKGLERNYKMGAKRRNIEYNLSYNEFKILVKQNCSYCDAEPKDFNIYLKKDGSKLAPNSRISKETIQRANTVCNGIDRIDSNLGYTTKNSIACCTVCNIMKNDHSKEFFHNHILKIAKKIGNFNE